jgi:hypothetical protein
MTTGIVHHKEAKGETSRIHHFREVTISTLLLIQISIQTNRELVLGQRKYKQKAFGQR